MPEPQNNRRTFLSNSLKWGALLLTGIIAYPLYRFSAFKAKPKPRLITVNKTLKPGSAHLDTEFVLFIHEGQAVAVSRTCTHLGCKLHFLAKEQILECPCHQSHFSMAGKRLAGPALLDLDTFSVEIKQDADGKTNGYVVTL
ncbi:MAG: Rieske 2Fe-2S domain-containing protein [Desulfobulbaceae bacterium]|nr:Rieske 2Fe-2S domain-containing protein [Desulfobulbaceae bacterium]